MVKKYYYKDYKAVSNYLNSSDPYAFQINGDWGVGKTYFIKNVIKHLYKYTKYIPVYISLNGINNINDVEKELKNNLLWSAYLVHSNRKGYSENKYKKYKRYKKLIDIMGSTLQNIKFNTKLFEFKHVIKEAINEIIENNKKNKILFVFDDLERVNINLQTLFGYFSNIIENTSDKIIIISSEKEIGLNKNDKKYYNIYLKRKEKVINKELYFGANVNDVASHILKKKLNNIVKDSKLKLWMIHIFKYFMKYLNNKGYVVNLRTLLSVISTYRIFYNILNKTNNNKIVLGQANKTGFLSILILTDILKRYGSTLFNYIRVALDPNIYTGEKYTKYLDVIGDISKYNTDFRNNIEYSSEIFHLVGNDSFNVTNFMSDLSVTFINVSIHSGWANKLHHFGLLSDDELKKCEVKLEKYLLNNFKEIKLGELIQIYGLVYFFKSNKLWLINSKIINKVKYNIKARIKHLTFNEALNIHLDNLNFPDDNSFDFIINDYNNKKKELINSHKYQILHDILNNKIVQMPNKYELFKKGDLFKVLVNHKSLIELFKTEHNAYIGLDNYIRYNVFSHNNDKKFPRKYIKYVNEFYDKLEQYYKCMSSNILKFQCKSMLSTVDSVKEYYNSDLSN